MRSILTNFFLFSENFFDDNNNFAPTFNVKFIIYYLLMLLLYCRMKVQIVTQNIHSTGVPLAAAAGQVPVPRQGEGGGTPGHGPAVPPRGRARRRQRPGRAVRPAHPSRGLLQ